MNSLNIRQDFKIQAAGHFGTTEFQASAETVRSPSVKTNGHPDTDSDDFFEGLVSESEKSESDGDSDAETAEDADDESNPNDSNFQSERERLQDIENDSSIANAVEDGVKSYIRRSIFPIGKATFYFPKSGETLGPIPSSISAHMRWKVNQGAPRIVRKALETAGFTVITKGKRWLACWGKHLAADRFKSFQTWQKINHFPFSYEIGRKDKMWINYCAMRLVHGVSAFNYVPETFLLPRNRANLDRNFSTNPAWIIKPPASARGIGIKVVTSQKSLPSSSKRKEYICSRYISNPLIINQRKFDLRIYVLVTSFEPLRVYVYQHGLARFASEPYTKMKSGVKKSVYRFSHLTNYSINKKNKKTQDTENLKRPLNGRLQEDNPELQEAKESMKDNKWSLEQLKAYFVKNGLDYEKVSKQVDSIIVKSIISISSQNVQGSRIYNNKESFELFGFDILIDSKLKAWLMECNISPALKGSCDMDLNLKYNLVVDIFNLIGIEIDNIKQMKSFSGGTYTGHAPPRKDSALQNNDKHRKAYNRHSKKNSDAFCILENLLEKDLQMLVQVEDELSRAGQFRRLWPSLEMKDHYAYFSGFNYFDSLLYEWTMQSDNSKERCRKLIILLNERMQDDTGPFISIPQSVNTGILSRPASGIRKLKSFETSSCTSSTLGGIKKMTFYETSSCSTLINEEIIATPHSTCFKGKIQN